MKRKNENGSTHAILIAVLIVIIVGLLGFVFWQNFTQTKTDTNQSNNKSNTDTSPDDSSSKIEFSDAKTFIEGVYDSISSKNDSVTKADILPAGYKQEGWDFYISATNGASIKLPSDADSSMIKSVTSDIRELLASNGFKETKQDDVDQFFDGKVACHLGGNPFSLLGCGDVADYLSTYSALKPFVEAYELSDQPSGINTSTYISGFSITKISDSQTNGYQTAEVSNGISAMLFYKKNVGDWQYFMSTQNTLQCSLYNTEDLRAAYKGEDCSVSDSMSMVQ